MRIASGQFTATILSAMALASFMSDAIADDNYSYRCGRDNQLRHIEVIYENPHLPVPCKVQYRKGGTLETLWNARQQTGYCEQKALRFADKQEGWGWRCAKLTNNESTAAEAPSNDEQNSMDSAQ